MKIIVLLKSVPDTASLLKIGADNRSVIGDEVKYVMGPYDEHALEEAVRLKESKGGEVIAVSMGDDNAGKILRNALAVGADSALFINNPPSLALTGRGVSKILAAAIKDFSPDVIFAGKQAVDDDASQVPERVAELLNISHASCITSFELKGETAEVDRESEGGSFTMQIPIPALFTVSKGINSPRYPTLPGIMKAKRKEIIEKSIDEMDADSFLRGADLEVKVLSKSHQKRLLKIMEGEMASQVSQLAASIHDGVAKSPLYCVVVFSLTCGIPYV